MTASIRVSFLSFIRAEQSYGPDDPYRYECRINENPLPPRFDTGGSMRARGHGKTPSEALDAALMPMLERQHEREKAPAEEKADD